MQPRAVDFVSYSVTDIDRAASFYRDTLGLAVTTPPFGGPEGRFAEFEVNGTTIGLASLPSEPVRGAAVALAVADAKATIDELRGKGVPIIMEPMESPVCFLAIVTDPDGNRIIIHQRKDGTAG